MKTLQDLLIRVRAEYVEMPDMKLTLQQVQRLCGIEPILCRSVLEAMVATRFLRRTAQGAYVRLAPGEARGLSIADDLASM